MVAIDAGQALSAADARTTEGRIAAATGVVRLVAGSALTGNALAGPSLHTVRVYGAARAAKPLSALDAVGLSPAAAGVV